jgi:hypothetical protein
VVAIFAEVAAEENVAPRGLALGAGGVETRIGSVGNWSSRGSFGVKGVSRASSVPRGGSPYGGCIMCFHTKTSSTMTRCSGRARLAFAELWHMAIYQWVSFGFSRNGSLVLSKHRLRCRG